MKRIVFSADGAWQSPMNNTNVNRLCKAFVVTSERVTLHGDGAGGHAQGILSVVQGGFG